VGILEWKSDAKKGRNTPPIFKLRGLEFSPVEIESIVQVETPESERKRGID
jgi:hypothetical protein